MNKMLNYNVYYWVVECGHFSSCCCLSRNNFHSPLSLKYQTKASVVAKASTTKQTRVQFDGIYTIYKWLLSL